MIRRLLSDIFATLFLLLPIVLTPVWAEEEVNESVKIYVRSEHAECQDPCRLESTKSVDGWKVVGRIFAERSV